MKSPRLLILVLAFLVCSAVASAQEPTPSPAATPLPPVAKVGAYKRIAASNRDVRAAYGFAVKSQAEKEKKPFAFVKVLKAESQVVAGTNYRICMLVREGKGRSKSVTVVVYKDLNGAWSLTQWVPDGCKEI